MAGEIIPTDLDEVVTGLYLGNILAATEVERRQELGITHVLSILDRPLSQETVAQVRYRFVHAHDSETFSLLPFFEECGEFIAKGLTAGRVLVHCVAGISRSATIVAAFLMSHQGKSLSQALETIRAARPFACPNAGFMRQLEIYEEMGNVLNISHPAYRRYQLEMFTEQVQVSGSLASIPDGLLSPVEDASSTSPQTLYRCRKCRTKLFHADALIKHREGEGEPAFDWRNRIPKSARGRRLERQVMCSRSLFVEPLDWMAEDILKMEGKVTCPGRCGGKLGSYVWYGERCPCGAWVAPAFHIQASKVDACKPVCLPASVSTQDAVNVSASVSTQDGVNIPASVSTQDAVKVSASVSTQDAVNIPASVLTQDAVSVPASVSTQDAVNVCVSTSVQDAVSVPASASVEDAVSLPTAVSVQDTVSLPASVAIEDAVNLLASASVQDDVNLPTAVSGQDAASLPASEST